MWLRNITRLAGVIILYFALHGVMAVLHEIYYFNSYIEILLAFPAGKLLGDLVFTVLRQAKLHSFWEEWFRETLGFAAIGILALACAEFWKNLLGLGFVPSLVPVVVLAYLVVDWNRKGDRPQGELS